MAIPLISTTAFAGIPEYVQAAVGLKGLDQVFGKAEIPLEIVAQPTRYVPQRDFVKVLEQAARKIGDKNLGLSLAPRLNIASWGPFGEYILQAPDVSQALDRAKRAIQFHGSMLFFDFLICEDELIIHYKNPTAGMVGYTHFAVCAAEIICSIATNILERSHSPLRLELDLPRPANPSSYEDLFRCEVVFDRPRIAIAYALNPDEHRRRECEITQTITMADLGRSLKKQAPSELSEVVREMIRVRLYCDNVDIEQVASHLGIGVRNLQRQLAAENFAFRDLVLQVRAERAMELLNETNASVTNIAMMLGYSSAAHFTRAFKQTMGLTPSEVRSA